MLVCISTLIKNKKTIGFRLCNVENRKVKDITYESLYSAMSDGTVEVQNLRVVNNKIIGYGGRLDRYTAINFDTKTIIGSASYVIISKYDVTNTYRVVDYNGNIQVMGSKKLSKLAVANAEINEIGEISPIECEFTQEELVGISILYRITYFIYICRDNFSGRLFVTNIRNIEDIKRAGKIDEITFDSDLNDILGDKAKVVLNAFKQQTPLFGIACVEGLTNEAINEILKYPIKKRDLRVLQWMLSTGSELAGIGFVENEDYLKVNINGIECRDEEGRNLIGALRIDITNGNLFGTIDGEWMICKFCSKDPIFKVITPKLRKELARSKAI